MGSKEIVKIGVNDPDVIKEDNANICEDDVLNFSELKPGEYSLHVYIIYRYKIIEISNEN